MASFEITIDFFISVFRYVPFHFHLGGVFSHEWENFSS